MNDNLMNDTKLYLETVSSNNKNKFKSKINVSV